LKTWFNKFISFCLLLTLLSCLTFSSKANAKTWSLFVGAGELYNPSSYRVGFESWEVGVLSARTFGVVKNAPVGNFYFSFGPAYVANNFGFFGAAGANWSFWNYLYLKGELNAARSISNYGFGSMMVGVGVSW
jgi:hypothetical protein